MKITKTNGNAFTIEFESEEELRREHRANLSVCGLSIPENLPLHSTVEIGFAGPFGGAANVRGTVVAPLATGSAIAIECDPDSLLNELLAKKEVPTIEEEIEDSPEKSQNVSDRLRGLTQTEKILLATKADRVERAFLIQDTDPRVLLSVLRNPRITVDEVVRVAKSPQLNYQIADVIMKTTQWLNNVDVRIALIHNPKTPGPFALRILPSLPESEIRTIARGAATSMALKQAALRKLQG